MNLKHKITILSGLFLFSLDAVAQCAMCRAVLESGADGSAAEGMNKGIVYLMAFPYIMIGIIGYFIYKSRKKAKAEGEVR